jgi:mitochondrial import receptor subunit TOM70
VSENKAVVYTVAGIAVVVTGGTVYYLSTSSQPKEPSQPRKSKNQRRKEKKKAEEEKKAQEVKATVEGEARQQLCRFSCTVRSF